MTDLTPQEEKILELAAEGAQIDGGHHKQWYLMQIIKQVSPKDYEALLDHLGEEGIPG